ncbi:response regulator transcription factor [Streptomyces blattellae]|uniref:response regulator transcription factor n=1 Tax=Streptomyces blattellae TaxID=2569855 RepID=UPI0018ACA96B|nr:helix-turn-helix transcriptional regulator [Streptomyces blattellae]
MADRLAFPWARTYDADQLAAFIEDLWGAASGDDDLATLDAIEKAVTYHRPADVPCPLSDRELEILTEVASGETRDSAARNLGISVESVRGRCPQIFARLGARNAPHAVAIAMRHGWIDDARVPELTDLPTRIAQGPMGWHLIYQARAAEMRKQPGMTVELGPYGSQNGARGAARRIRKGQFRPFRPAGAFDARQVRTDGGQWIVRASYTATPTSTEKAAS